jgi:hypothetical protein
MDVHTNVDQRLQRTPREYFEISPFRERINTADHNVRGK